MCIEDEHWYTEVSGNVYHYTIIKLMVSLGELKLTLAWIVAGSHTLCIEDEHWHT